MRFCGIQIFALGTPLHGGREPCKHIIVDFSPLGGIYGLILDVQKLHLLG